MDLFSSQDKNHPQLSNEAEDLIIEPQDAKYIADEQPVEIIDDVDDYLEQDEVEEDEVEEEEEYLSEQDDEANLAEEEDAQDQDSVVQAEDPGEMVPPAEETAQQDEEAVCVPAPVSRSVFCQFGPYDELFRTLDAGYATLFRILKLICKPSHYQLWLTLMQFQTNEHPPAPTYGELAEALGKTERTIALTVEEMVHLGLMTLQPALHNGRPVIEKCLYGLYELAAIYHDWESSSMYVPPKREHSVSLNALGERFMAWLCHFYNYRSFLTRRKPGPKASRASAAQETASPCEDTPTSSQEASVEMKEYAILKYNDIVCHHCKHVLLHDNPNGRLIKHNTFPWLAMLLQEQGVLLADPARVPHAPSSTQISEQKQARPVEKPKQTEPAEKPKQAEPAEKPKQTEPVEKPKTTEMLKQVARQIRIEQVEQEVAAQARFEQDAHIPVQESKLKQITQQLMQETAQGTEGNEKQTLPPKEVMCRPVAGVWKTNYDPRCNSLGSYLRINDVVYNVKYPLFAHLRTLKWYDVEHEMEIFEQKSTFLSIVYHYYLKGEVSDDVCEEEMRWANEWADICLQNFQIRNMGSLLERQRVFCATLEHRTALREGIYGKPESALQDLETLQKNGAVVANEAEWLEQHGTIEMRDNVQPSIMLNQFVPPKWQQVRDQHLSGVQVEPASMRNQQVMQVEPAMVRNQSQPQQPQSGIRQQVEQQRVEPETVRTPEQASQTRESRKMSGIFIGEAGNWQEVSMPMDGKQENNEEEYPPQPEQQIGENVEMDVPAEQYPQQQSHQAQKQQNYPPQQQRQPQLQQEYSQPQQGQQRSQQSQRVPARSQQEYPEQQQYEQPRRAAAQPQQPQQRQSGQRQPQQPQQGSARSQQQYPEEQPNPQQQEHVQSRQGYREQQQNPQRSRRAQSRSRQEDPEQQGYREEQQNPQQSRQAHAQPQQRHAQQQQYSPQQEQVQPQRAQPQPQQGYTQQPQRAETQPQQQSSQQQEQVQPQSQQRYSQQPQSAQAQPQQQSSQQLQRVETQPQQRYAQPQGSQEPQQRHAQPQQRSQESQQRYTRPQQRAQESQRGSAHPQQEYSEQQQQRYPEQPQQGHQQQQRYSEQRMQDQQQQRHPEQHMQGQQQQRLDKQQQRVQQQQEWYAKQQQKFQQQQKWYGQSQQRYQQSQQRYQQPQQGYTEQPQRHPEQQQYSQSRQEYPEQQQQQQYYQSRDDRRPVRERSNEQEYARQQENDRQQQQSSQQPGADRRADYDDPRLRNQYSQQDEYVEEEYLEEDEYLDEEEEYLEDEEEEYLEDEEEEYLEDEEEEYLEDEEEEYLEEDSVQQQYSESAPVVQYRNPPQEGDPPINEKTGLPYYDPRNLPKFPKPAKGSTPDEVLRLAVKHTESIVVRSTSSSLPEHADAAESAKNVLHEAEASNNTTPPTQNSTTEVKPKRKYTRRNPTNKKKSSSGKKGHAKKEGSDDEDQQAETAPSSSSTEQEQSNTSHERIVNAQEVKEARPEEQDMQASRQQMPGDASPNAQEIVAPSDAKETKQTPTEKKNGRKKKPVSGEPESASTAREPVEDFAIKEEPHPPQRSADVKRQEQRQPPLSRAPEPKGQGQRYQQQPSRMPEPKGQGQRRQSPSSGMQGHQEGPAPPGKRYKRENYTVDEKGTIVFKFDVRDPQAWVRAWSQNPEMNETIRQHNSMQLDEQLEAEKRQQNIERSADEEWLKKNPNVARFIQGSYQRNQMIKGEENESQSSRNTAPKNGYSTRDQYGRNTWKVIPRRPKRYH